MLINRNIDAMEAVDEAQERPIVFVLEKVRAKINSLIDITLQML